MSGILSPNNIVSQDLFGIHSGSVRDPFGLCSGSVRDPFGVRSGSVRDPFGFRSGSENFLSENRRSPKKPQPRVEGESDSPPLPTADTGSYYIYLLLNLLPNAITIAKVGSCTPRETVEEF